MKVAASGFSLTLPAFRDHSLCTKKMYSQLSKWCRPKSHNVSERGLLK